MEGGLDMATRKRLANRFRAEYAKGTKKQKGEVIDRLVAVGMGRSTARRLLSQAVGSEERPGPGRGRRPKYGEETQRLLERLWLLMGMPCGPYMKAMLDQWIPALRADGELDDVDGDALEQVRSMSASTIDRRLGPLKRAAMPRGMSLTRPAGEHLRNSVQIRKCTDEIARLPGLAEADTVAHCGPSARGEFARTLTMADYATNRAADVTARNNAKSNIRKAVDLAIPLFPFPVTCFDSDNGTESINDELIDRLQHKDIEQTRSRPYRKNDQATVESRNNHVVRKFAFYWRYDTEEQRDLPDRLWADLPAAEPVHPDAKAGPYRAGARRAQEDRLRPAPHPVGARTGIRCGQPRRRRPGLRRRRHPDAHRKSDRLHQPRPVGPRDRRHPGRTRTAQPRTHRRHGAPTGPGHGILGKGDRTHARRRRTRQQIGTQAPFRAHLQ